jgi:hypothetical protein
MIFLPAGILHKESMSKGSVMRFDETMETASDSSSRCDTNRAPDIAHKTRRGFDIIERTVELEVGFTAKKGGRFYLRPFGHKIKKQM